MKPNEIGHFPYVKPTVDNPFKDCHPRQYIAHTEDGKLELTVDGNIKWVNNWKVIGEVDLIDVPKGLKFTELLVDLQTYNDCYCADILEVPEEVEGETIKYVLEVERETIKYVFLRGSGWSDLGFPFYDDAISDKDVYVTGNGCYAMLRGKARDRFIKIAKQDRLPTFEDCFTGDIKKDFVLPKY